MGSENTSDKFKLIDFTKLHLFVMSRMCFEKTEIKMTSIETEKRIDVLMVIKTDDDKN